MCIRCNHFYCICHCVRGTTKPKLRTANFTATFENIKRKHSKEKKIVMNSISQKSSSLLWCRNQWAILFRTTMTISDTRSVVFNPMLLLLVFVLCYFKNKNIFFLSRRFVHFHHKHTYLLSLAPAADRCSTICTNHFRSDSYTHTISISSLCLCFYSCIANEWICMRNSN